MIIQWPNLKVASFRFRFVENQLVHSGPFGSQGLATSAPVLEAELMGVPQYWTDAEAAQTFLESLKGYQNQLALHNMTRPVPLGTLRGVMALSSPAAIGATTLQIRSTDLGSERVANGIFDSGLASWTITKAGTSDVTVAGGAASFLGDGANQVMLSQIVPTVAGVEHKFAFDIGSNGINVSVGSTAGGAELYPSTTQTVGSKSITFVPTGSAAYIRFFKSSATVTTLDNISVKANRSGLQTLKQGDWLGIGSGTTQQVVKVAADATADSAGNITITTTTPLRNAFPADSPITWDKPTALFRQKSLNDGIEFMPVVGQPWALSLREDWRA